MSPTIPANSYLIFHHLIYRQFLKTGTIIKMQHPIYGLIVKKIISIDQQGFYWLGGLNNHSITSQQMGAIDLQMITGIVIY
ncbi:MAG: hypothetical protein V5786_10525, partial [Psychromonas sp.]